MTQDNQHHSVFGKVLECARANPQKTAFHSFREDGWQTLTYGSFMAGAISLARYMKFMDIQAGTRIVICAENSHEWCTVYLAAAARAAHTVPIDPELGEEEIRNLINAAKPSIIFTSAERKTKVTAAADYFKGQIMSFDESKYKEAVSAVAAQNDLIDLRFAQPSETASLIFTSGTTGSPKAVVLSHGNLTADCDAIVHAGLITAGDNVLSALPYHHTYPFMCSFLVPLTLGASITYPPSLKGAELARTIKDRCVTILIGVPRLLELLLNAIEGKIALKPSYLSKTLFTLRDAAGAMRHYGKFNAGKALFKSVHEAFGPQLRFLASGGAKLDASVMKRLESYGFTVVEGYGLTETSPVVTFNPINKRKAGSAGIALKGAEIKIQPVQTLSPEELTNELTDQLTDELTEESTGEPTGEQRAQASNDSSAALHDPTACQTGEILLKGPMVFKGYYENPEETAKAFTDGWFRTGDIGYIDNEGYLFITGRLKEVIVLGSGKNIYPEDVERKYMSIPLVKEICITSIDAKTLHAVIFPDMEVAKALKTANLRERIKWDINDVSGNLPSYMRVNAFTLVPEPLPKTRLGKIRRFMIKGLIEGTEKPSKPQPKAAETTDPLARNIVEIIQRVAASDTVPLPGDNLELDVGLDSLRRLEMITALEESFGIHFTEESATEIITVGNVIDAVRKLKDDLELNHDIITNTKATKTTTSYKEILEKAPPMEVLKAAGINASLTQRFLGAISIAVTRYLIRIYFGLTISGLENVPKGAYVFCPNHVSYLDAFFMAAALPAKFQKGLYFQGAEEFFRGFIGRLFARIAHVIAINTDTHLQKALSTSAWLIKNGNALCIFPEGGRSPDGSLQSFKKGPAILAIELGVPLLPVYIDGAFDAMPRGSGKIRRTKVTVTVGKPVQPGDFSSVEGDRYQIMIDTVKQRIREIQEAGQ